jgi:hypothetical protein
MLAIEYTGYITASAISPVPANKLTTHHSTHINLLNSSIITKLNIKCEENLAIYINKASNSVTFYNQEWDTIANYYPVAIYLFLFISSYNCVLI